MGINAKRYMKFIIIVAASSVIAGAILSFLFQDEQEIEAIDGLVYSFIVGKVEGNDDLLATLLKEEAQGIIKPGRHAFPGAAEEMGNRYSIKRFSNLYDEGVMIYEITFYRPPTQKMDYYNVVVQNTNKGWLIAKNSHVDSDWVDFQKQQETGVVVHPFGGAESE